jgi:hypothetical protein
VEFPARKQNSQSGQAVVEYILILVAVVGIMLGAVYQFNDAFRSWANNYFGEYLACLLETGELPSIDGAPGDSGICTQLFKPFSLVEGRPLLAGKGSTGGEGEEGGRGTGTKETDRAGRSPGGSYTRVSSSGSFGRSRGGGAAAGLSGSRQKLGGKDSTYTGSTASGNYGGGYSSLNRRLNTGVRYRIDRRFAFEDEREEKQKNRSVASSKGGPDTTRKDGRVKLKNKAKSTDQVQADSEPMTFGNFLRILIIVAIVIGLIVFLGGQMLQVGKSME